MLTRVQLQQLARDRLKDASCLLKNRRWSGAYYLAGYSVECGLKACIAKLMKSDMFPDKGFSKECYTHEIERLVALAELKTVRDLATANDQDLSANWSVVKDWSEQSRYQATNKVKAQELYDAINDRKHGVMPWIITRW